MKKLLIFVFFLSLCSTSNAQLLVRPFLFRPTGNLGFVFKPAPAIEIGYASGEDRIISRFGVSFTTLQPRQSSFPITTVVTGAKNAVMPGTEEYKLYGSIIFSGGADFSFYSIKNFDCYVGGQLQMGLVLISGTRDVPGFMSEDFSGPQFLCGLRPEAGIRYNLSDRLSVFVNASRTGFFLTENGFFGANEYGAGAIFNFD